MYTISSTLQMKIRKTDCPQGDSETLDKWLREIINEAHREVCNRLHAHGFTVETNLAGIYYLGEKDG